MRKKKYVPIFSGDESTAMWKEVCDIQYKEVRIALYGVMCKIQELEGRVRKLSEGK